MRPPDACVLMNIENKKTALDDDAAIYQRVEEASSSKTEREKFRELSFKGKVRYFMDYYALKVALVLFFGGLIIYGLYTMLKPKPTTMVQAAIIDSPWIASEIEAYSEKLPEALGLDPKKETAAILTGYLSENTNDGAAIATFVFAGNLDIIISPLKQTNQYIENGVFYALDDTLPEDLRSVIPEADFVRGTIRDHDQGEHIYAIRITDTAFAKAVNPNGYPIGDMYLGIHPCSEERVAEAFEMLRVMYGLPIQGKSGK